MDQRYSEAGQLFDEGVASRYDERERRREQAFELIWSERINGVFSDVASYYDRANTVATLGVIDPLRRQFVSWMNIPSAARLLDVCAGTNTLGREVQAANPAVEIWSLDRSMAMQEEGRRLAQ